MYVQLMDLTAPKEVYLDYLEEQPQIITEIFTVWSVYIHFEPIMRLKKHERLCDNNDYCHVGMPTKDNNTLKYNHGEKSLKTPFTIYADLECLLIKEQFCQNNPKESYTERKAKHEPSAYSLSLICSFNSN